MTSFFVDENVQVSMANGATDILQSRPRIAFTVHAVACARMAELRV